MPTHANVDRIRKGYDAFSRGDMDALSNLIAEDVVWHVPGRSQLAGDYQGRDKTFAYFGKLAELSGGTFKLDMHTILADDEHAVGLHHDSGSRSGKTLDTNEVLTFHMRDGIIVEAWEAYTDPYNWDDFWS